ncbi:MAG: peptide chain release factor N(5)-glutamine methyltransferase [Prevotella sp.]|nr:peptide chain release factor N(5)-glutamine methyltransferase [Prevotella sp.]
MTYTELWHQLSAVYDPVEAKAIARLVLDVCYGLTLADILGGAVERLSTQQETELGAIRDRLLTGEPVQYVLGKASFCGRWMHVEPGVLIPRPETEELCRWILDDISQSEEKQSCSILDIGTGSGCIACTLAAELPDAHLSAWDISERALDIARENAQRTHVDVLFQLRDVLHLGSSDLGMTFDVIVSNPPYVCRREQAGMLPHVTEHEPHLALFVPDDDPLCFYKAIGRYALATLSMGGKLYFELNEHYAHETADMLRELGFCDVIIRKDQYNKDRFIRACKTKDN